MAPIGRIGRYSIVGRIAVGGMAEIFLARESGPRSVARNVVVKRILPQIAEDQAHIESFVREAELYMRLRHPNICATYEFGEEAGSFFLGLEFVHGVTLRDLADRATRAGGMPLELVAKIIADVARALHYAHAQKNKSGEPLAIVHRDVTPENIMVGFDGSVKLLDFGIARFKSDQQTTTSNGTLKGKFAYMSPEQYRREPLDARSDIFSLGVCMYETLTGQSLFDRGTEFQTVAAILFEQERPSIRTLRSDVPEAIDAILASALERDRAHRCPSADVLERRLLEWLNGAGHIVRNRDVGEFTAKMFPERARAGPKLNRSDAVRESTAPKRNRSIETLAFRADFEEEEAKLARTQRRKKMAIGVVGGAVVLGVLAASAYAFSASTNRRADELSPAPSRQDSGEQPSREQPSREQPSREQSTTKN